MGDRQWGDGRIEVFRKGRLVEILGEYAGRACCFEGLFGVLLRSNAGADMLVSAASDRYII